MLQSRKKIVDTLLNQTISTKPEVPQSYHRQIVNHCSQYQQIKKYVSEMTKNPAFFKQLTEKSNVFWLNNEKIQNDLENKLKNLKQIDLHIDRMVEEEINMAKQIEGIQQSIRNILNKKQPDHISRAQPLYVKKELYIGRLRDMKKEKEQFKEQKLFELTKILQLLYQMKKMRKKRLQECRQPNFSQQSIALFECLSNDIEQLTENKITMQAQQNNQKKLTMLVNELSQKIHRLSKQMSETFQTQFKAFEQIANLVKSKGELNAFREKLSSFFQTSGDELIALNERFSQFIQIETQKSTELNQVEQGINTTEDTIQIFQNLKRNIETEALRKRQLIEKITRLNNSYSIEKQRRQAISESQAKIQGLKINLSKFQTMLEEAAEQADVKQYKTIHCQLSQHCRFIKIQQSDLEKLKSLKRQSAKRIYSETNNIQQEYRDLISEMFPQIWLRDNDFTRDQRISDFQIYLGKLFSRLKILA